MKEYEGKMERLLEIKDKLIDAVGHEFDKGIESVDVDEAGKVIDMIYDLAKAEKNCYEAKYYKTVIEAMEEGEEEWERSGYTRYPHKRPMPWFKPYVDQEPYIDEYLEDPVMVENMRMGYTGNRGHGMGGRPTHTGEGDRRTTQTDHDVRYGRPFNEYRTAKKHYTETNAPHEKEIMKTHAYEHVADTLTTAREIWKDADPELKKRMKADFTALVGEMAI